MLNTTFWLYKPCWEVLPSTSKFPPTRITEPLKEAILQHLFQYTEDVGQLHIKGSNCLCRQRCESYLRGQTTLEQLLVLMNTFMHFMQAKCNNGQRNWKTLSIAYHMLHMFVCVSLGLDLICHLVTCQVLVALCEVAKFRMLCIDLVLPKSRWWRDCGNMLSPLVFCSGRQHISVHAEHFPHPDLKSSSSTYVWGTKYVDSHRFLAQTWSALSQCSHVV